LTVDSHKQVEAAKARERDSDHEWEDSTAFSMTFSPTHGPFAAKGSKGEKAVKTEETDGAGKKTGETKTGSLPSAVASST